MEHFSSAATRKRARISEANGSKRTGGFRRNTRENSSNQNHHRVMMGHTCPFSFSLETNPGLAKASFIVHDAVLRHGVKEV